MTLGSESVAVDEQGSEESNQNIDDQTGNRESCHALEGRLEADREARDEEHDDTDEGQDDGHGITPILLSEGLGFI